MDSPNDHGPQLKKSSLLIILINAQHSMDHMCYQMLLRQIRNKFRKFTLYYLHTVHVQCVAFLFYHYFKHLYLPNILKTHSNLCVCEYFQGVDQQLSIKNLKDLVFLNTNTFTSSKKQTNKTKKLRPAEFKLWGHNYVIQLKKKCIYMKWYLCFQKRSTRAILEKSRSFSVVYY